MKLRKVLVAGTMAAVLSGVTLEVSAAETNTNRYAEMLKEDGKANLILDIAAYRAAYKDLEAVFGDDEGAYLEHYLNYGIYEGRTEGALFNPLAYAEAYSDVKEAFGEDIAAIVDHYVTFGVAENRTMGAVNHNTGSVQVQAPALAARANAGGTVSYTGNSSAVSYDNAGANNTVNSNGFRHTTSIYANDGQTLLRVEYYDDNNKLYEYSSVTNFDSSTNSYTENIYYWDKENETSVLTRTDTYVNGVLSSSVNQ